MHTETHEIFHLSVL